MDNENQYESIKKDRKSQSQSRSSRRQQPLSQMQFSQDSYRKTLQMQNKEFENLQDGANSLSLNKESPSLGYANEKKESEIDKINYQELDQK